VAQKYVIKLLQSYHFLTGDMIALGAKIWSQALAYRLSEKDMTLADRHCWIGKNV
jgi:hypothetical protein